MNHRSHKHSLFLGFKIMVSSSKNSSTFSENQTWICQKLCQTFIPCYHFHIEVRRKVFWRNEWEIAKFLKNKILKMPQIVWDDQILYPKKMLCQIVVLQLENSFRFLFCAEKCMLCFIDRLWINLKIQNWNNLFNRDER